jgi:hypothetical protein
MAKTQAEIAALKENWEADGTWDIEDTEGFEEHYDELLKFRRECEARWERERLKKEAAIDAEADTIGARGLYRMVLALQQRIDRLEAASARLMLGERRQAYQALRGDYD